VHSAMVHVVQVCRQLSSRTRKLSQCTVNDGPDDGQTNCPKHVVSLQNKFVKLVYLVGFIVKKLITMHGHMNVKFII
jgi:hypothetical protein